ncbi:hypothetical protein PR048_020222 [Dryococelus australis]|uniref:Uncharacterized protein n=1 Tax=Dryococelus australis TaxID=614101 RepID=A0ABQ9H5P6_9NEOP|nr:hypothetical protein PR048_020222 [Dryococelus australis]
MTFYLNKSLKSDRRVQYQDENGRVIQSDNSVELRGTLRGEVPPPGARSAPWVTASVVESEVDVRTLNEGRMSEYPCLHGMAVDREWSCTQFKPRRRTAGLAVNYKISHQQLMRGNSTDIRNVSPDNISRKQPWKEWREEIYATWVRYEKRKGSKEMLLASNLDQPGSIPGGVTPRILHVGIVPDDAIDRRVFSRISCFPRPYIPVLLYTHLASPSSALKTAATNLKWGINVKRNSLSLRAAVVGHPGSMTCTSESAFSHPGKPGGCCQCPSGFLTLLQKLTPCNRYLPFAYPYGSKGVEKLSNCEAEGSGRAMLWGHLYLSTISGSACPDADEPRWRNEAGPRTGETTSPHENLNELPPSIPSSTTERALKLALRATQTHASVALWLGRVMRSAGVQFFPPATRLYETSSKDVLFLPSNQGTCADDESLVYVSIADCIRTRQKSSLTGQQHGATPFSNESLAMYLPADRKSVRSPVLIVSLAVLITWHSCDDHMVTPAPLMFHDDDRMYSSQTRAALSSAPIRTVAVFVGVFVDA